MSATPSPRSPLASLVLFITCLAMAAGIFAAAHYLVIDLPAQNNVQAPENAAYSAQGCETCEKNCIIYQIMGDRDRYYACREQCGVECST